MINKYSIIYSSFYYSKLQKDILELINSVVEEKESLYTGSAKQILRKIIELKDLRKTYSFILKNKLIVLDLSNQKDFITIVEYKANMDKLAWPIVNPDKIYYGVIR